MSGRSADSLPIDLRPSCSDTSVHGWTGTLRSLSFLGSPSQAVGDQVGGRSQLVNLVGCALT